MIASLLLAALLAQAEPEIEVISARYDEENGRFLVLGSVSDLPDETVVAGALSVGKSSHAWSRANPEGGVFRLEFPTDGRKPIAGRYEVRLLLRPEDQAPETASPDVAIARREFDVGTAEEAARDAARLREEDLAAIEELRATFVECAKKSIEARGARRIQLWEGYALPEKHAWTTFTKLREASQARDGALYLHPSPARQNALAAVLGCWEKWFFSLWTETCQALHAPLPKDVGEVGDGGQFRLDSCENSLRRAAKT
ncbi:MAG: hypothetical protein AAB434_09900, partial [Planctomycetota bacterium]